MVKNYHGTKPDHRYEPSRKAPFITKRSIFGAPDMAKVSTAYMERNNATMRHHIGRMRRLCYAFSKKLAHHKAAVALGYVHYNLCSVVSTLRVTPAVAAGVISSVWDIETLLDALLTEAPCERPEKQPLKLRVPEEPARELPNGRGFLRLVGGSGAPKAASAHVELPPVPAAPAASKRPAKPAEAAPEPKGQLDLLSYRPKPRKPEQLSLF